MTNLLIFRIDKDLVVITSNCYVFYSNYINSTQFEVKKLNYLFELILKMKNSIQVTRIRNFKTLSS